MAYWLGSTYDRQSRRALEASGAVLPYGALVLYLAPRQFAVPTSDISAGNWTTQVGGTTNLFSVVDESPPDDSDYIRSETGPVNSPVTLAFGTLSTPQSGPRYIRYRYGKDTAGAQINLTVELLEGVSVVQSWSHTDVPLGFTPATQQITNAISDYGNLRVRFTANQV